MRCSATSTPCGGAWSGWSRSNYAILEAIRRVESLLLDERGRRELLERSVEELKQHVATLQARIEELERRIHR